ncbi:hypothetical protein MOTE_11460 [Moorella thermoacetica]|uniref:Uncharacterized protein n=1 Tax=Neomoorella thermoacetica TaxID=1525 RepID=A0A1J5NK41_NEOTH|nr:hypothetical protein MOTE_11460 [Moorella thermoacetica]
MGEEEIRDEQKTFRHELVREESPGICGTWRQKVKI